MEQIDTIMARLRANMAALRQEYGVKSLGIFGSRRRGEETEDSDLDLLVEFERPISLLHYVALERRLSELLGEKVDLVMRSALKPRIGERILQEVMPV